MRIIIIIPVRDADLNIDCAAGLPSSTRTHENTSKCRSRLFSKQHKFMTTFEMSS